MPRGVDRVPHAEHQEAGFADAHCPGHAFYCYFSGAVFVFRVHDLAVVVVVSGEDSLYVSYCRNESHGVFFAEHILILVTSGEGDSIPFVREDWCSLTFRRCCWRPMFSFGTTWSSLFSIERDMRKQNCGQFSFALSWVEGWEV